HNPTDREFNLRGFSIGDDGARRHRFDTDLLILPGEFLTLARSSNPGFTADYVYDNFTLSNSGDEIVLRDGLLELLRLDYGSGFAVAGRSRELLQLPMLASSYGLTLASLSYGLGDIGTPGAAGGALPPPSAVPLPAAAWLFISAILAMLSPSAYRASRNVVPAPPKVIPAQAGTSQRLLPTIPNRLNFLRFNRSRQS
ncbi:MAG: lamin tail domain-containing protein, partial [Gammaproteobacteria bacterium]|nr:lamin tail domain-containing protein [Gammaproteobacteria bacterium]